jgi:hypothetical protein
MKTLLAILILAAGCQAASAQVKAQEIKHGCDAYVAAKNNGSKYDTADHLKIGVGCFAYVRGALDEMEGELTWGDDNHTKLVAGNWQDGVTADQMIMVLVKYANENPAVLNKPASAILRQSAEAAGLYIYSSVTK